MIHPNGFHPRLDTPAPARVPTADDDVCPDCQGMGFIALDVPVDHPDFGQAFPCHCTQAAQARRRITQMSEFSQLALLADKTFATFLQEPPGYDEPSRASLRQAFNLCHSFEAETGQWLFLQGPNGCGKTHLAAAVAHQVQAQGTPVLLLPVSDLLDHLRATFTPDSPLAYDELFQLVRDVPVLVLDDLGAEKSTEFARDKLFQLLNHRYLARRATVITSNLLVLALEDRIRSRLADIRQVTRVTIEAPDFRGYHAPHPLTDLGLQLNQLSLHREQRFGNFDVKRVAQTQQQIATMRRKLQRVQEFADTATGWLVLNGPHGCGKTHLAAAVAHGWVMKGHQVLFVPYRALKDCLRSTLSRYADALPRLITQLQQVSYLVLDDYRGREMSTGQGHETWASEQVRGILEHRFYTRRPTVLTLCLPADYMDDWLAPRVAEVDRSIHILVQDFPQRARSTTKSKRYPIRS